MLKFIKSIVLINLLIKINKNEGTLYDIKKKKKHFFYTENNQFFFLFFIIVEKIILI